MRFYTLIQSLDFWNFAFTEIMKYIEIENMKLIRIQQIG